MTAIAAEHERGAAPAVEKEDGLAGLRQGLAQGIRKGAAEHGGIARLQLGAHVHDLDRRKLAHVGHRWPDLGLDDRSG